MEHKVSTASSKKFTYLSLLVVVLCVLFIALLYRSKNRVANQVNLPNIIPTKSQITGGANVQLKTTSSQNSFTAGEPVSLTAYADSDNNDIVGYDVVVLYDPTLVDFERASSLQPNFKLVASDKAGVLYLTGVKDLSAKEQSLFAQTAIVDMSFVTKKSGTASFAVQYTLGKTDDSNLMNTKTQDVLKSVAGVSVEIK